jgi:pimeloyl-ACP methyl ester carboxylesterase
MALHEPIEPAEGLLKVDGGVLHYLDWGGAGPQAHFLHGNGFCAGTYAPFIRHLVPELRVIASDVRGHGGSQFPDMERIGHWRTFAEDLRLLIRKVQSPPVIGMGHSLGAVTSCIAAAEDPSLFRALVLIDPVFLPPRTLWALAAARLLGLRGRVPRAILARRRRRVFRNKAEALRLYLSGRGIFKRWAPEFVEAYLECGLLEKDEAAAVLRCDPELEAQIFESVPADVWRYVKRVECPVLAVRGAESDVFSAEAANRLERTLARCEVATIEGSGHFPPMEKPGECARVIRAFLRE